MKQIDNCDDLFELSKKERLKELQKVREMALMALVQGNPRTLPNGMRIEVITSEFKGTGEEPHFHLFPANHRTRDGRANNYDLITRVAITKEIPSQPSDIHAIANNEPVPKEYQEAIYEWSQKDDEEFGLNNWRQLQLFWNKMSNTLSYGQLQRDK